MATANIKNTVRIWIEDSSVDVSGEFKDGEIITVTAGRETIELEYTEASDYNNHGRCGSCGEKFGILFNREKFWQGFVCPCLSFYRKSLIAALTAGLLNSRLNTDDPCLGSSTSNFGSFSPKNGLFWE